MAGENRATIIAAVIGGVCAIGAVGWQLHGSKTCTAGEQKDCHCGAISGYQVCLAGGKSYAACRCAKPAPNPDEPPVVRVEPPVIIRMPETRKLRNSPWAGDVLESLGKGTEVKKLAFIDDGYPPDRDGDLRRWFYVQ